LEQGFTIFLSFNQRWFRSILIVGDLAWACEGTKKLEKEREEPVSPGSTEIGLIKIWEQWANLM